MKNVELVFLKIDATNFLKKLQENWQLKGLSAKLKLDARAERLNFFVF